jgi:hypothetical protein
MPKLEDLFKQKVLESSGKTAKETFAPQNSKRIPIRSSNVIINKFAEPLNKVRLGRASVTEGETRLEETLTGLRPLRFLSQPALYGTNIVRLTTQTTVDVDAMKDARGGSGRGLIGGVLAKARAAITSAVNSIGLFPYAVFPTTLTNNLTYKLTSSGFASDYRRRSILSNSKGTGLGALIKSAVTAPMGGEDQGAQIGGSAVSAIKSAGRKLLLGDGKLQDPQVKWDYDKMKWSNYYTYSDGLRLAKDPQTSQQFRNDLSSVLYDYDTLDIQDIIKFTSTGILPPFPLSISPDLDTYSGNNKFGKNQKLQIDSPELLKRLQRAAPPKNATDTDRLFSKLVVNTTYKNNKGYISETDGTIRYADTLNAQLPYVGEAGKIDNNSIEDLDLIRLKFSSPSRAKKKGMSALFRATITGLTETMTPTWEPNKFIGNPFNFYTYTSIEKTLGFTFKIYSSNQKEHIAVWQRLNFLTSLVYPQGYVDGAIVPPFIKFSMGDLYKDKDCFIESLTYTIPDDTTWETGTDQLRRNKAGNWVREETLRQYNFDTVNDELTATVISEDVTKYKLPSVIEVAISLKIVDDRSTVEKNNLYSFYPMMQNDKKPQQLPTNLPSPYVEPTGKIIKK